MEDPAKARLREYQKRRRENFTEEQRERERTRNRIRVRERYARDKAFREQRKQRERDRYYEIKHNKKRVRKKKDKKKITYVALDRKFKWALLRGSALYRCSKAHPSTDGRFLRMFCTSIPNPEFNENVYNALDAEYMTFNEVVYVLRSVRERLRKFGRVFERHHLRHADIIDGYVDEFHAKDDGLDFAPGDLLRWTEMMQYLLLDTVMRPYPPIPAGCKAEFKTHNLHIAFADLHIASFYLDRIIDQQTSKCQHMV